jgi:hypothetical protein
MIERDGYEEDDELFLDVDPDSDDGIPKVERPQSFNSNGESLVPTPNPRPHLHLTLIVTLAL